MAINHADGTTLAAFLVAPVVAGAAAADAHAGWFTIVFVVLGVAAGFGVAYAVRAVAYFVLFSAASHKSPWVGWPMMIGYTILPTTIAGLGWAGIWFGTTWLVKHFL